MAHESSLKIWFSRKKASFNEDLQYDHRLIECSLIRALSDYRKKEISDVRLSENFNDRLMARLEKENIENQKNQVENVWRPGYAILATAAILTISLTLIFSDKPENDKLLNPSFTKAMTPISAANFGSSSDSDSEKILLNSLRQNPGAMEVLKKLEGYYRGSGNIHMAREIHYKIEQISR
ncbi:MAG: hypothetical protein H7A25_08520 [Leptospiraceae bacterium]|nr:hypothetical protein [Leptospiraceae bacterium]MCP5499932.1 hypothetical protein [Leptospiraceae bacterium]